MKTLLLFALMALASAENDLYVLEKIDLDAFDTNIGKFKELVDCFVSKGPCSELYLSYKVLVPESMAQGCRKCTIEQKQFVYKFYEMLKANLPEDFVLFNQIYDPEKKYYKALDIEVNKYKNV